MIPAHGAFVLLLGGGLLLLVNTAHLGGTLVHEHGVHAMLPMGSSSAFLPATLEGHDDDD